MPAQIGIAFRGSGMDEKEQLDTAHEAAEHGDAKVAMLVTLLAALLAVTEMSGKGAQTEALVANVTSNDLWSYYQAKSTRGTFVSTLADVLEDAKVGLGAEAQAPIEKRVAALRDKAAHYESDPASHDGRKEIEERAHETERERDAALAKYHTMEYAAAFLQLAIVLCSISIILKQRLLIVAGGLLGIAGLVFTIIGWTRPELIAGLF